MASIATGKTGTWTRGPFYTGLWVYFRNKELVFFIPFAVYITFSKHDLSRKPLGLFAVLAASVATEDDPP